VNTWKVIIEVPAEVLVHLKYRTTETQMIKNQELVLGL
jgi:hypothetical protein